MVDVFADVPTEAPTPLPPCPSPILGNCDCPEERGEPAPNGCVLWNVPYQRLILAAVIWLVSLASPGIVHTLIALLGVFLKHTYKKKAWTDIIRMHVSYWTTWLLRWGLIWAGVVVASLPDNVYNVIRYFFSIPFFIILILWSNGVFDGISDIIYMEQSEKSKIEQERKKTQEEQEPSESESSKFVSDSLRGDDDLDDVDHGASDMVGQTTTITEAIRVIKYIVFTFLFIFMLQSNNVPVVDFFESATLLTLVVAFAAQPWLRNLIGGLLIFFDDKFDVNEYIRVVGIEGTVREKTLRVTCLERPDKSRVYIPNSRIMEQPVANFSRRKTRLLEVRVKLDPNTPPQKIRHLIASLEHSFKTLHPSLTSHPKNRFYLQQGSQTGGADFFVVLDNLFELLVWAHVSEDEKNEKPFRDIQTEVMLAVKREMQILGISSDDDGEVRKDKKDANPLPEHTDFTRNLEHEQHYHNLSYTGTGEDYNDDDVDIAITTAAVLAIDDGSGERFL